jgi:site-specific recombinase XerD
MYLREELAYAKIPVFQTKLCSPRVIILVATSSPYGAGDFGQKGKRHAIHFITTAKTTLQRLHAKRDGQYVCPEAQSDTQYDWRRWLDNVVEKAGIENLRKHDLRYPFASRLVTTGVDLRTVQNLLGHNPS